MKKTLMTTEEVKSAIIQCEQCLFDLKKKWDEEKPKKSGWVSIPTDYLLSGTIFIIKSIDDMIQFVEPIIPKGEDKKAVVMLVAGQLYDYIVISIFPLWLRPMSSTIKKILISIVVGELIDFIVSKYRNGLWNMEKNDKKDPAQV